MGSGTARDADRHQGGVAIGSLETLAGELAKLKALGHTAVALDPLISYVDGLTQSARATGPETERQRIRLQFEGQVEHFRAKTESDLTMFKAVIEAGQSALKILSLVNGAGAVAVLAFLGNVLSRPTESGLAAAPAMSRSMTAFALGVGLAAVGFAARYFGQACYAGDLATDEATRRTWGRRWRNVAVGAGLGSLIAFFVAIGLAFNAVK